jgi:hypothetical protein
MGKIDPDTITINFEQNKVVSKILDFTISEGKKSVTTNGTKNIKVQITNPTAREYLSNWEQMIRFEYQTMLSLQKGGLDKDHENIADEILQVAAKFELEMQRYHIGLDSNQVLRHTKEKEKKGQPKKK